MIYFTNSWCLNLIYFTNNWCSNLIYFTNNWCLNLIYFTNNWCSNLNCDFIASKLLTLLIFPVVEHYYFKSKYNQIAYFFLTFKSIKAATIFFYFLIFYNILSISICVMVSGFKPIESSFMMILNNCHAILLFSEFNRDQI